MRQTFGYCDYPVLFGGSSAKGDEPETSLDELTRDVKSRTHSWSTTIRRWTSVVNLNHSGFLVSLTFSSSPKAIFGVMASGCGIRVMLALLTFGV
jgi:hypothetical protein